MTSTMFPLTALSPEELTKHLSSLAENNATVTSRFVALSVSGAQVVVRPFSFQNVAPADVPARLRFEAVDLLSLPAEEIELDFQICQATSQKISGVFICVPKKFLHQYVSVVESAGLKPVKITAQIVSMVDSFFKKHKTGNGRFCLLDFTARGDVHLAVLSKDDCEFLRTIHFEDQHEARLEIIQSLRSASAKSSVKQFQHIYVTGEIEDKDELISRLALDFATQIERTAFSDVSAALGSEENFFTLNLLHDHVFSMAERKKILTVANIVVCAAVIVAVSVFAKVLWTQKIIHDITSSYKPVDYNRARLFDEQLKSL